jgi:hypothetical protein
VTVFLIIIALGGRFCPRCWSSVMFFRRKLATKIRPSAYAAAVRL